jgi:hypothetical protein
VSSELSTVVPLSAAVPLTTSSMSRTIESKSAVASGWKTIAAVPRGVSPIDVSSVTFAVLIANSLSGAGPSSLRLPVRMSKRPIRGRAYAVPCSCDSSRWSAAIRASSGGWVENSVAMLCLAFGGKM